MAISAEQVEQLSREALDVPLMEFIGASLTDGEAAARSLSFSLTDSVANALGALHGGVIAAVLETAAFLAVLPHLEPGEQALTHGFAASYLGAAPTGEDLRAHGSLLRRTQRLAFISAQLASKSDVLAVATVTKSIRSGSRDQRRPGAESR
jgi:uncharacterized protein (TIGR00369 family)